jgi:hypothetical protein
MTAPNIVQHYLDMMDLQRETIFAVLKGMRETSLWDFPRTAEWSIGEILDHTRAVNASFLTVIRLAWFFGRGWAALRRSKPYPCEIDDVYRRPGFPMKVGWMWPPRVSAKNPITLAALERSLVQVHARYRLFFEAKEPDLLGQIWLYDPAIGKVNLIQKLRVGLYHDLLHFQDAQKLTREIKQHTTPVA